MQQELIKARNSVFRLLKFRARSKQEIIDRLKKKKFSGSVIKNTVEYFQELNYINDNDFAASWVSTKIAKPLGPRRIFFELKQKGVGEEIIEEAWDKASKDYSELSVALSLAEKRMRLNRGIDKNKAKQRIYGYLNRRGFSPDVIIEVLQKL